MFGKKTTLPTTKGTAPTYVGQGMKIEGQLRCAGPIRTDGEIRGTIDCESEITIGPTAYIVATIHAARIIVNGRIEGNLFTTSHLEVLPEGHIIGNVSNPPGCLIVHEGAVIEGQCLTYDAPPTKESISVSEKKMIAVSPKESSQKLNSFFNNDPSKNNAPVKETISQNSSTKQNEFEKF